MTLHLKIARRVNFFVTGSISALYLTGKLWNGKKVRKSLEWKKDDNAVPMSPKLNGLIEQVLKEIKSERELTNEVEPFMSSNVELKNYGFSVFGLKTFLAIPWYFLHDSVDEADFTIMIKNKEIPNNTPDFNYLKMHMCLSDDAKKFAIARQIYEAQYSEILTAGALPLVIAINCNIISFIIQKIYAKRKHSLFTTHGVVFVFGIWLHFFLYDLMSSFIEGHSDFLAAALGRSYVKGGIEYYEKMLKRNKILRKIDSSLPINEKGEIKWSLFRTLHIPISKRITYLKDISKAKNPSVWSYFI